MHTRRWFVCAALVMFAGRAQAGPVEVAHDWLQLDECKHALEAAATIDPADKLLRAGAEAAARRCTLDDAELATSLRVLQALRLQVDQSHWAEIDEFIADTEALQKQLHDNAPLAQQLRADMAAMNAASDLLEHDKCYEALREVNKVSEDDRKSVRWIRLHAKLEICTGTSMDLQSVGTAVYDLDALHRHFPGNQILAKDYEDATKRSEEIAKEAKEMRKRVNESIVAGMTEMIERERPHLQAAQSYLDQGNCTAASREIKDLTESTQRRWLEVKIGRCINTKESLADADKSLDEIERVGKIYFHEDPAVASTRTEIQAQRELLIADENGRAARAKHAAENRYKPQALPPKYTAGIAATYLSYDAGSGSELQAVMQPGYLDVAVGGTTSGPEKGFFSARAALHLFAFPYPAYTKQSLALSAGFTLRTPMFAESSMAKTTLRPYLGLEARLTCVLHVTASYEPALSDGDSAVLGLGLELFATISHKRGFDAVCHE